MNQLIEVEEYKTKAQRPVNSILNSERFEKEFDYKINNWRDELNDIITN